MVNFLVIVLLSGLYVIFQPNVVRIYEHQVVIQTVLGMPVYELQHGRRITLGGPFFKAYRFQERRMRKTIVRPHDYPALSKFAKGSKPDATMVIDWSHRDPWRIATQFGLPVDWGKIGRTVILPAVLSTARRSQSDSNKSSPIIRLAVKAGTDLRRRKIGLSIDGLSLPDEKQDLKALPYGPSQHFSRHLKRPRRPEDQQIEKFTADIDGIIARDQHLIKIDNLAIHFAVVDNEKFEKTFGREHNARKLARGRVEFMVTMGLIRRIGGIASSELDKFDPVSVIQMRGQQLKKELLDWGIVIAEIGDEKSTFRTSLERQ